ncbi:pseudouridine synthase [Sphingomonas sp. TZW2008]|uniref:pseudouridine synthase n=1 Tax=Sphingomonas sp. TZW2008 TaxID=1917973 RepID=UPI000A26E2AD|nr:pseudouridine synthase [Sphingomonas sp. TZW2008]
MPKTSPDRSATHRIAKLLARAGVASRREVERMIAEGRVSLHGAVVDTPATILPSLAGVTVDGNAVAEAEPARLFLYHKPPGLLTTERDPAGRPTIYDRLPKGLPRLMPVGRLDLSTEGLLLMTTDGELKRQLELPATGVERAYRARAYGQISQPQLEELIDGIEIEGIRYGSIDANIERRTGANVWIEMILKEGKNREVRRVLEHLGLQVSRLIRTRYGPFLLGDLQPGQIGEVRRHDVESFRADPVRRDLPQPARRRAVTPVELPADAVLKPTPPAGSEKSRVAKPARGGKPPAKDEPRRRADGTVATRGAKGPSARTRSFRAARGDEADRPPAAARGAHSSIPVARSRDEAGAGRTTGVSRGRPTRSAERPTSNAKQEDNQRVGAGRRTDRSAPSGNTERPVRAGGSRSADNDRRPASGTGGSRPGARTRPSTPKPGKPRPGSPRGKR